MPKTRDIHVLHSLSLLGRLKISFVGAAGARGRVLEFVVLYSNVQRRLEGQMKMDNAACCPPNTEQTGNVGEQHHLPKAEIELWVYLGKVRL